MVLPGHLAGGYLTANAILALAPATAAFSPTQTLILLAIGTIFGDGPDIDLFIYNFNQKSSRPDADENGHRHYVTHTPIFWLGLSLLIVLGGWIAGSLFTQFVGWMILGGSWTHLLLDSIEFGVRWLWPFSQRRFCLREVEEPVIDQQKGTLAYYRELIAKTAFRNVTFYAEIIITIVAIVVAYQQFF
ncbi:MAG: rane-bound metal-dependent hydrolase [Candidatus Parcubacteria bacterium]|nr:rane-bound metal-dependent hydrolase [Candidatus Parcubacteria bacterium]